MPAMAPGWTRRPWPRSWRTRRWPRPEVLALGPAPDVVDVSALGTRASDGRSVFTDPPGPSGTPPRASWTWRSTYWPRPAARWPSWPHRHAADVALAGADLGADQAEVAAGLLTARTAVSVLVAPAGAGKTHVMAAYARAWTAITGGRVVGVTLSTNAANVMADRGPGRGVQRGPGARPPGGRVHGPSARARPPGRRWSLTRRPRSPLRTWPRSWWPSRGGRRPPRPGRGHGPARRGGGGRHDAPHCAPTSGTGSWPRCTASTRSGRRWPRSSSGRARGPRSGPMTREAGSAAATQAEAERDAVALYLADHLHGPGHAPPGGHE